MRSPDRVRRHPRPGPLQTAGRRGRPEGLPRHLNGDEHGYLQALVPETVEVSVVLVVGSVAMSFADHGRLPF